MMRSILVVLFIVSAFANVGDEIYATCQTITNPVRLQVCATLNQGEGCNVNTTLVVANNRIFSKNVDLSKEDAACGTYSAGDLSCDICLNFTTPNAEIMCLDSQPICKYQGFPIAVSPVDGGCFPQSRLQQVRDCLNVSCPLVNGQPCSGHGTCSQGTCACDQGFSGEDCSLATGTWENCVVLADGANLCTRILYETCRIGIRIIGISGPFEYTLYNRDISAANFKNVITQSNICENSTSICTNCLEWSGVTVTEESAKGCVKMNSKCGPLQRTYELGCFDDETITPQCFACTADTCSSHGSCNAGICSCYPNWSGESCNIPVKCGSDCHGHGDCVDDGVCSCYDGYSGDQCEIGEGIPPKPKNRVGIAFAVLIPLFLVGAGIGAGAYIYMKKKKSKPAFNQFDLLEQDEADQMLD